MPQIRHAAIDEYLKAHLFGDIFRRDNLDRKTREIATIAALLVLPGADSQLQAHIGIGKNNGVTDEQVAEILALTTGNEYGVPRISDFPVGAVNRTKYPAQAYQLGKNI